MKYTEIRSQIASGDILAWTHRSWGSIYDIKVQLVRFFTQSEYSHVGTAWVVGDRVFVIEAVLPTVRVYPLSKYDEFFLIPIGAKWSRDTEALALSKVGQKYSTWEAIKSLFVKLKDDDIWECAELCAKIATSDGINLGDRYTPSDIVRKAQLLGKHTILVTT
jgi:hypothetical protein